MLLLACKEQSYAASLVIFFTYSLTHLATRDTVKGKIDVKTMRKIFKLSGEMVIIAVLYVKNIARRQI